MRHQVRDWLPTSQKEMKLHQWDEVDVVLFTGDAYIDHPSFGAAVIGRILEAEGYKVAVVPQPNWQDDLRDFKKFGAPRLFFAVTAGNMDSMVNHYTANRRLRSNDAYTAEGRAGARPDYPTIVYSNILKELFPEVPIIIGGIEASQRRFTHYDYWQDKLLPSILDLCGADLLIYGMGERSIVEVAKKLEKGIPIHGLENIPQSAFIRNSGDVSEHKNWPDKVLNSHDTCLENKTLFANNFKKIEIESNRASTVRLIQNIGDKVLVINPPQPTMKEDYLDKVHALPYTRLPHPRYKGKHFPAYEMIKFSVNLHRGCFGGCSFCTISAHQGKFVTSRSQQSVLDEVKKLTQLDDFKGYLTDLGGPSGNMYKMEGKDLAQCDSCIRASCIDPTICDNLNTDHQPMIDLYKAVDALPSIKKSFISSGIRYDLLLEPGSGKPSSPDKDEFLHELITNHVSGRLKVAPEHTEKAVLKLMRKPPYELFKAFQKHFETINKEAGLKQQLIPYFISSHPGCQPEDMAELAVKTKESGFQLEQVQDFTPTPMTLATVIYYAGINPYTGKETFTARTKEQKLAQKNFFFWYKGEAKKAIRQSLRKIGREDLVGKLLG